MLNYVRDNMGVRRCRTWQYECTRLHIDACLTSIDAHFAVCKHLSATLGIEGHNQSRSHFLSPVRKVKRRMSSWNLRCMVRTEHHLSRRSRDYIFDVELMQRSKFSAVVFGRGVTGHRSTIRYTLHASRTIGYRE